MFHGVSLKELVNQRDMIRRAMSHQYTAGTIQWVWELIVRLQTEKHLISTKEKDKLALIFANCLYRKHGIKVEELNLLMELIPLLFKKIESNDMRLSYSRLRILAIDDSLPTLTFMLLVNDAVPKDESSRNFARWAWTA